MNCPNDMTELKQITKEEVVINFCPSCRGVWLDRGELDKIIERSLETHSLRNHSNQKEVPVGSNKTGGSSHYLGALFDLDEPGAEAGGFFRDKR